uniref:Uncharacterized protein n=1 Tax=Aegilops tauschii subsp. strangulata TaxID=200361 RepID=A0A453SE65_AEGTS
EQRGFIICLLETIKLAVLYDSLLNSRHHFYCQPFFSTQKLEDLVLLARVSCPTRHILSSG